MSGRVTHGTKGYQYDPPEGPDPDAPGNAAKKRGKAASVIGRLRVGKLKDVQRIFPDPHRLGVLTRIPSHPCRDSHDILFAGVGVLSRTPQANRTGSVKHNETFGKDVSLTLDAITPPEKLAETGQDLAKLAATIVQSVIDKFVVGKDLVPCNGLGLADVTVETHGSLGSSHWHVEMEFFNLAMNPANNNVQSVRNLADPVFHEQPVNSARMQKRMADYLTSRGIETTVHGRNVAVAAVPRELCEELSPSTPVFKALREAGHTSSDYMAHVARKMPEIRLAVPEGATPAVALACRVAEMDRKAAGLGIDGPALRQKLNTPVVGLGPKNDFESKAVAIGCVGLTAESLGRPRTRNELIVEALFNSLLCPKTTEAAILAEVDRRISLALSPKHHTPELSAIRYTVPAPDGSNEPATVITKFAPLRVIEAELDAERARQAKEQKSKSPPTAEQAPGGPAPPRGAEQVGAAHDHYQKQDAQERARRGEEKPAPGQAPEVGTKPEPGPKPGQKAKKAKVVKEGDLPPFGQRVRDWARAVNPFRKGDRHTTTISPGREAEAFIRWYDPATKKRSHWEAAKAMLKTFFGADPGDVARLGERVYRDQRRHARLPAGSRLIIEDPRRELTPDQEAILRRIASRDWAVVEVRRIAVAERVHPAPSPLQKPGQGKPDIDITPAAKKFRQPPGH